MQAPGWRARERPCIMRRMSATEPASIYEEARALQQAGDLARAAALYMQVLASEPEHFRALNNLAVCRTEAGEIDAAEALYRRALAVAPEAAPVLHNLARLLHQHDRFGEAEPLYRRAITAAPEMLEAHFNLGRLLQETGRPHDAESTLRAAAQLEPDAARAHSFLGDALFQQQRLPEALASYQEAAALDPTYAVAQFDVGKTLETLKREREAVASYRRATELDPGAEAPREALVRALEATGQHAEALAELHTWLAASPGHPLATHLLAALGGTEAPERASDDYVRNTFDRFAADFDRTLTRLQYRAPNLVAALVELAHGAGTKSLDVLDVGCGTGLCAPLLAPYARTLVGVDLSEGMLAQAAKRGLYDALLAEELTTHMAAHPLAYDLVVSADTFCYLGALEAAMAAAFAALRPGGLLAFTLEDLGDHDDADAVYALHVGGRYAHRSAYAANVLHAAGFTELTIGHGDLRREGGTPVKGLLLSARRRV